jgi:GNAT superfamily N-acetyltransferase
MIHQADKLPAFVAESRRGLQGLVTYRFDGAECEIVSLNSLSESIGIGEALLNAVKDVASGSDCRRIWLITTNDNLAAIRFYQKRGFRLVAVHRDAIAQSRRLKPTIPETGIDGIPIRDEVELEIPL